MRCVWRCRSAPVTLGEPKDAVVSGVSAKNSPGKPYSAVFWPFFVRWANFFAPKLLAARRDETVNTNAGTSALLRETRDAFAHQDRAENGCFCLAMVSSVSPKTEHSQAKVMTVSRKSPTPPVGHSTSRVTQKSHAIRSDEFSTKSENVEIPTV